MFTERFEEICKNKGKDIALISAKTGRKITYDSLYQLSGKVYEYLKAKGIGKGSVVMIYLPREVQPVIALVGIWRAGACATMVATEFARERRDYIYRDAGCSLMIDSELFNEMMDCEERKGYEKVSPFDPCYIVYTSGTTGNPKGVMHQFGMQDLCIKGNYCDGIRVMDKGDRLALTSPLNFAATLLMILPILYNGATLVIFPMETVRNPDDFMKYLKEYNITITFVTPSMLRRIPSFPDTIKKLITGGERADDIYYENIDVYCLYAQSESCFNITSFRIDKKYSTTPVGKPCVKEACVCILDEKGEPVKDGEAGLICYKDPYFGGYINLPEMTEKIRLGEYISTGDIGHRLPDGNIVLNGRNDDMIKIRGNRVEPAEIEKVLSRILGVEWTAVRAFAEKETTYICAYYIDDPKVSTEQAREELKDHLSSYMLPSFFVKLDAVPLNNNGKFSRKNLPKPDISSYMHKYSAPENEEEKKLCRAMEKVLHIEKVGVYDNFCDMGGDSVSIMSLLTELDWPLLDYKTVLSEGTPKKIAERYKRLLSVGQKERDSKNKEALRQDQPLLLSQQYMFDYQCYVPKSTTWNLNILLKFSKDTDIEGVKNAVGKVLRTHPVFSTIYCFNDDTELVQRYIEDMDLNVETEKLSEDEFVIEMENLVKPYKLLNSKMYRVRLFQTEKGGYLFMDLHHSIADGTSLQILIRDLCYAYEGKELMEDHYYLKLTERRLEAKSSLYEEGKRYYSELLDQNEWDCYPKPDAELVVNGYGNLKAVIPIDTGKYEELQEKSGVTKNAFFLTVTLLAISIYNDKRDIKISWIFNGREKEEDQSIIGTLIREFYVGIHFKKDLTVEELYLDVNRQIRNNMIYACYPYPGPERLDNEGIDAGFLYQQNLRDIASEGALDFSLIEIPQKDPVADNLLDIEIQEIKEGCLLYMDYIPECYKPESINRFRDIFIKTACLLVSHIEEPLYKTDKIREEVIYE
ncbi:MAG: AMP-binding protein [Lachnospiraceae bacterium]|nr:AMP-binding protein [Lachnospiraceae bacterium]